jgi:Cu2+-containing amine oxidase
MKPDSEINARKKYDLLSVVKDGKSRLIDFDGNIVVDYQGKYNIVRSYRGIVFDCNYKGMYQTKLLDLQLNPIIENVNSVDFKDDFFAIHLKNRIVIFDYSKKILHDLKADGIEFHDKFFIVQLKGEGTLYDYNGNRLFDKTYSNLTNIGDNLFSYSINGKTALMDINTKEIIPSVCDSIKLGQCGVIECHTK